MAKRTRPKSCSKNNFKQKNQFQQANPTGNQNLTLWPLLVASVPDSHRADPRADSPPDWLLYHGDNRDRHSANHNLLPDMHLRVRVMRVIMCHDSRIVQDVREVTGKL